MNELHEDVRRQEYDWVPSVFERLEDIGDRAAEMEVNINVSTGGDTEDVSPYLSYLDAFSPEGCRMFMRILKVVWPTLSEADKKRIAFLMDGGDRSKVEIPELVSEVEEA